MLSALEERARAIGAAAQARAIATGATRLQVAFPDLVVTVGADAIVLSGRIAPEDARLRWIGSMLT